MIKTILIALREARQIRKFMEIADKAEFWQPIDGKALVGFMVTNPGKKLRARLANMVFKSAIQACSVTDNGDYSRGIARGVMLTVQALDQHMEFAKQIEEEDFAESDTNSLEELSVR